MKKRFVWIGVAKFVNWFWDYLRAVPLTFMLVYIFLGVMVIITGSAYETVIIQLLANYLGIKENSFSLNTYQVRNLMFGLWFGIGTIFHIAEKMTKVKTKRRYRLLILELLFVILWLGMQAQTKTGGSGIVLLIAATISLVIYEILSLAKDVWSKMLSQVI